MAVMSLSAASDRGPFAKESDMHGFPFPNLSIIVLAAILGGACSSTSRFSTSDGTSSM